MYLKKEDMEDGNIHPFVAGLSFLYTVNIAMTRLCKRVFFSAYKDTEFC